MTKNYQPGSAERLLLTRRLRKKPPAVFDRKRNPESDAVAVKNYIALNFRRKIMIGEPAERR